MLVFIYFLTLLDFLSISCFALLLYPNVRFTLLCCSFEHCLRACILLGLMIRTSYMAAFIWNGLVVRVDAHKEVAFDCDDDKQWPHKNSNQRQNHQFNDLQHDVGEALPRLFLKQKFWIFVKRESKWTYLVNSLQKPDG